MAPRIWFAPTPLGTYPVNEGDTVLLVASAQLGMGSDQGGVDLNPQ